MKTVLETGMNALPPIFKNIPIIYDNDEYRTPKEIQTALKTEAENRRLRKENRLLKKELTALRQKLEASKK